MPIAHFRKPIIAANWKMHMTPQESDDFIRSFARLVPDKCPIQIVVSPPFVSLERSMTALQNAREQSVELAAQNMSAAPAGAFTGEISARMIKECGCKHVILGHSERRSLYGETNAIVNAKVLAALEARLHPILCIGETLEERDSGKIEQVLESQLRESLAEVGPRRITDIVIAYEPVWAIGTGRTREDPHPIRWQRETRQYGRTHQPARRGRCTRRRSQHGTRQFLGDLPCSDRLDERQRVALNATSQLN